MNPKQKRRRRRHRRVARRVANRTARRQARRAQQQQRFREPHTPTSAHRAAVATVNTEFRPTERQIGNEIRGTNKREKEISDWYKQLGDEYAAAQQEAAKAADQANAATQASLEQSSKNTADLLKGLAAQDASFAAKVGGPTDTAGQKEEAEAAAAAERMRAALQAPNINQRAINIASYGSKRATAALAGIGAHKANAARRRKQKSDLKALRGERGSAIVKALEGIREGDRNYSIQRAALGGKREEQQTKRGYNKALERQAAAGLKGKQVSARAQENAARLYSEGKITAAEYQERIAKIQRGASNRRAKSNENVARQQGRNARRKAKHSGGYTVAEAAKLVRGSGEQFRTPGEAVQYLVNRGVKEGVAKRAVHRVYSAARAAR